MRRSSRLGMGQVKDGSTVETALLQRRRRGFRRLGWPAIGKWAGRMLKPALFALGAPVRIGAMAVAAAKRHRRQG